LYYYDQRFKILDFGGRLEELPEKSLRSVRRIMPDWEGSNSINVFSVVTPSFGPSPFLKSVQKLKTKN